MGRDSECDIQFDSRKISRRHCCIAQVADQLVVRDLGSTNGIRINGVRVLEGYLKAGDELAIGNHRYVVRWDTLPPGQMQAQPARPVTKIPERQPPVAGEPVRELAKASSDLLIPLVELADDKPPKAQAAAPGPAIPTPQPAASSNPPSSAAGPLVNILPDKLRLSPVTDDFPALSPRGRAESMRGNAPQPPRKRGEGR
jgi:hypothetical protein